MVKNDITVKILSELMHYNNYCYVTDLRGGVYRDYYRKRLMLNKKREIK